MGGLSRFFCLSSNPRRRDGWPPGRQQYAEAYAPQHSKILEILEEELDHRLGGISIAVQSLGNVPLQRMYKAGLPPQEMQQCKELLGKIAALGQAREAADEEKAQLNQALKAAEASHRQAEFSRAKAEALATARGEALMHAQQATREAQREQTQLSEMLKQALQQLGMAMTPNRSPAGTPEGSLVAYDQSPSPHPFLALTHHQDPRVAGTPLQLPQPAHDKQHQQHRLQTHEQQQPQQQQQQSTAATAAVEPQRSRGGSEASLDLSREFSGFTVYTNRLHDSVELSMSAQAGQAAWGSAGGRGGTAGARQEEEDEVRQSRVPWRDISSAVEASLSVDYASSSGQTGPPSLAGSVGQLAAAVGASAASGVGHSRTSQDRQQQLALVLQGADGLAAVPAAAPAAAAGPEQRQQQIQRIARLVLPTLDASQLDSLVRIGASLPSPDMLMSPEVLSQLLPKLWDSSDNPLQSAAGPMDVQQLLEQINSQQQAEEQQATASRPGLRAVASSGRGEREGAVVVAPGQVGRLGWPKDGRGAHPKKAPKAGTWLSPLKIGQRQVPGEPSPSPQSHVKAVFRDDHDIQFYLPFSAGLQKPNTAAKEEYKTRAKQAAAVVPPPAIVALPTAAAPAALASSSSSPRGARPKKRDVPAPTTAAAPPTRQSRRPTSVEEQLSSWDLAVQQQQQQQPAEGSLPPRQPGGSAEVRPSTAGSLHASSLRGSREAPAQQPAGRKQAFLSRFQPMGQAALQPAGQGGPATQGSSRPSSMNENSREGMAAGLRRQPSGEVRQQQQQEPRRLGSKASAESAIALAASAAQDGQPGKRASDPLYKGAFSAAALADSTNAGGESYLRRLAQQRVQQAYGPPSH